MTDHEVITFLRGRYRHVLKDSPLSSIPTDGDDEQGDCEEEDDELDMNYVVI